jgi:hypothetical protein
MTTTATAPATERAGRIPVDQLHVFYYYIRDQANRPTTTVCFVCDETGTEYARGCAKCSLNDNPCKAIGRRIAYRRALRAYYSQQEWSYGAAPDGYGFLKFVKRPLVTPLEHKFLQLAAKSPVAV